MCADEQVKTLVEVAKCGKATRESMGEKFEKNELAGIVAAFGSCLIGLHVPLEEVKDISNRAIEIIKNEIEFKDLLQKDSNQESCGCKVCQIRKATCGQDEFGD